MTHPQGLWLWVRSPEYTQDWRYTARGPEPNPQKDSSALALGLAPDGKWWSCDAETYDKDLALLYRTSLDDDGNKLNGPYSNICWLIETRGQRYSIEHEPIAQEHGWKWGTDYQVLARFSRCLHIRKMKKDPTLARWEAVTANLQGRKGVWPVSMNYWKALALLLVAMNLDAKPIFAEHMRPTPEWLT
jgi:hypothetical protein